MFCCCFPNSGDVPRVDGQLAVARAFGDKSLKMHLSSEPHVEVELIDDDTEFVILASDGLWKVGNFLTSLTKSYPINPLFFSFFFDVESYFLNYHNSFGLIFFECE